MSDTIQVQITHEIPEGVIAGLLCSGFEGGVGYWCVIVDYVEPEAPRSTGGDDKIFKHIDYPLLKGGAVVCSRTDVEDPKRLILNREAVERGLKLMAENHPRHFTDFIEGDSDSTTGDIFIQLCLLGKVVYG